MGTAEKHPVSRIIILGANGQVGNSIYSYLKLHFPALQITACVRRSSANTHSPDYTLFDPFAHNWQQIGKADILINCIGIIQETRDFTFEQAHLGLTRLILQNRQILGDPKIIQISALGAKSDSQAAFLSSKGRADELLLTQPRSVVIRPSIVCTANTVFAQKLTLLSRISRYLWNYLPFPEHLLQTCIQPIMPEDLASLVAKLCFTDQHPASISAVGPDEISLQELIRLSGKPISLLPVPRIVSDPGIRLVAAILPHILNRQQYALLLHHNTANKEVAESLIGRSLHSTKKFWQQSMSDGEHIVKKSPSI
jgi:uncharacterized protein YbjT (DUF2867 family)